MDISNLLITLGLNISSNVIYDIIENYLKKTTSPTKEGLKETLISELKINGAEIKADKIIEFLAKNGDITIEGTSIYASEKIELVSSKNTFFSFGNNSISKTDKTAIETRGNSKIVGKDGAKIVQDKDGSIRFYT